MHSEQNILGYVSERTYCVPKVKRNIVFKWTLIKTYTQQFRTVPIEKQKGRRALPQQKKVDVIVPLYFRHQNLPITNCSENTGSVVCFRSIFSVSELGLQTFTNFHGTSLSVCSKRDFCTLSSGLRFVVKNIKNKTNIMINKGWIHQLKRTIDHDELAYN